MQKYENKNLQAFTLLELIIVMTVLGIISVIVFIGVNPSELMARARDTGRMTSVTVIGRGLTTFYTSKNATYPNEIGWDQELVNDQSLSSFPRGLEYFVNSISACTTNVKPDSLPTFCYDNDESGQYGAIVYAKLESTRNLLKCNSPNMPYVVYSTTDGRAGIICASSDPHPWPSGAQSYIE